MNMQQMTNQLLSLGIRGAGAAVVAASLSAGQVLAEQQTVGPSFVVDREIQEIVGDAESRSDLPQMKRDTAWTFFTAISAGACLAALVLAKHRS